MSSRIPDANLPQMGPSHAFWRLSPELRNHIYNQVYDADITNGDTITLMRTSKQFYFEVGSNFYARHPINLSFPLRPTMGATVLPPISDSFLPFLKEIGLELEVGPSHLSRVKEIAATIRKLTTIGANFHEITILIQFTSKISTFMQDQLDDSIMDGNHLITAALCHLLDSGVCQSVKVALNGAYFAPGVATSLKAGHGECLKFIQLEDSPLMSEINDPILCERQLTGHSSVDLLQIFDIPIEQVDESLLTIIGKDLDFPDPVQDMEEDDIMSLILEQDDLELNDETETSGDDDAAELNSDDDVDMDDLIPLAQGEADAIIDSLKHTEDLLAEEARTKSEIELLVNLAPELLFAHQ